MSMLIRREKRAVVSTNSAYQVKASHAEKSIRDIQYTITKDTWDNVEGMLPPEAKTGLSIATSVQTLSGALRKDGRHYQRRLAWRATPEGISIFHLRRELSQQQDGKFRPAGVWFLAETEFFPFAEAPKKRTGVVPFTATPSPQSSEEKTQGTAVDNADVHMTLALLPSVVQTYVLNAIPLPTREEGASWIFLDKDGLPTDGSLAYLRMDETKAVVITAERSAPGHIAADTHVYERRCALLDETSWTVTQTTARLGTSISVSQVRGTNMQSIGGGS